MKPLLSLVLVLMYVRTTIEASYFAQFTKPEFTNDTKNALKGFAPLQDLRQLNLCHVVPFSIIEKRLNSIIIGNENKLKPNQDGMYKYFIPTRPGPKQTRMGCDPAHCR